MLLLSSINHIKHFNIIILLPENQKKCGDYMPGGFLELPVYEDEDISSDEIWDDGKSQLWKLNFKLY